MKTHVTFRSTSFPPYDGEEERLNPGIWGQRLVEYLVEKLGAEGVVTGEPIAEDWGWYLPVPTERGRLAICCGHQDGEDDEFLCFTDPARPIVRRGLRKVDLTEDLQRVLGALGRVLSSDAAIGDVIWSDAGA